MDGAMFKKTIEYFGEENIIGIGFDNSAGLTFGEGQFTLENFYIEELESLQMIEYDIKGNPYHVIKHVETIQCIMVRDSSVNFNDYDMITIRC